MFGGGVFLFVFLLTLSILGLVYADCSDRKPELQYELGLFKNLTCSYNSNYRPVRDHKTVVSVKLRFDFKYLTYDPEKETITVHSRVLLTWKDELLTWVPSDYGNIEKLIVDSYDIWSPGMVLYNADGRFQSSGNVYAKCLLTNDGSVMCSPLMAHTVLCSMTLRQWPYDEQHCSFYFGSWMHTGEQVNFTFYQNTPLVLDEFQNAPGWKLLKVDHDRITGKHTCCPNITNQMLKFTFLLRREATGLVASVIFPSVVAVLLTLSSFLLDVKDNTRLIMVCFSLFNHFAILMEIGYLVPKLSSDTPIILLFVRDSMIMTLLGVLETLLLMSLIRRLVPAPTFIVTFNRLVGKSLGKYAIFTEFDPCIGVELKLITEEGSANCNDERARTDMDWIKFTNLVNSCVLIIAYVVYLFLMCIYIPIAN